MEVLMGFESKLVQSIYSQYLVIVLSMNNVISICTICSHVEVWLAFKIFRHLKRIPNLGNQSINNNHEEKQ